VWALLTQFFVNPVFLVGLAAASIPVILHLRYRRTAVELPFPSLKLLRLSTKRVARRKKVEELLLLIVRALLLALLAIALAKPFLKATGFLASRSNTAVAIVLDNSGSMATRVGGQKRLDIARARAENIVSGLTAGGSVKCGVFLSAGSDDQEPGQTLTHRIEDVRTALAKAEPSLRQSSLAGAVARALDALTASGDPHRELYLITDMQAYGLHEVLDQLRKRDRSQHLYAALVPVETGQPKDLAVTDLTYSGRGLLVRTPLTVEATIKNQSDHACEADAELFLDGSRAASRSVNVGGGATATVSFPVSFESAGLKTAAIEVKDDDNPTNDRRVLALPVEEALRVLVVEGAGSTMEFQNASYYVARALDPFGSEEGSASSGIRPLKMPEQALLTEDLAKYRCIFLLNPGALSLEALKRLKTYVREGGGLIVFPGQATDGPRLTADLGLSAATELNAEGILPARIGARFGKPSSERAPTEEDKPEARVVDIAFAHPVLAPFKGLDRTLFTAIQVNAGYELAVPAGGSAETLLMLDGQRPFLVGGPVGAGEVFLFASAPTPDWTNLPVRSGSVFLPMMHTLCHYLAGRRTQSGSLIVGHAILAPAAPQERKGLLVAPDNQEQPISAAAAEPLVADLGRTGVWRTIMGPRPEDTQAYSVNFDPKEADAEQLALGEVREALQVVAVEALIAEDVDGLNAALKRIREGVPLWNFFLVLVLILAVVEVYLANRVKTAAAPGVEPDAGAMLAPVAAPVSEHAPAANVES
jgi:hypothetical protein